MPVLTRQSAEEFLSRFRIVAPDAQPQWGKMNGAQMLGHVAGVVYYSMGRGPDVPFRGNFKTQYIYAPLLLNGVLKFPKNVRIPRKKGQPQLEPPSGDYDGLVAAVNALLAEVEKGEFNPVHHPYFGHIGVKGWLKFHAAHFDHHLRQFGV